MTGIKVTVGLIILEGTGPVSVADSISYWFLNSMLLQIPFEMNSPWMMCWNWGEGKISWLLEFSTPNEITGPREIRIKIQHGKGWKGFGKSLSVRLFPTLWGGSWYGPHILFC